MRTSLSIIAFVACGPAACSTSDRPTCEPAAVAGPLLLPGGPEAGRYSLQVANQAACQAGTQTIQGPRGASGPAGSTGAQGTTGNNAIDSASFAAGAVGSSGLATGAVTAAKLAAGAIGTAAINSAEVQRRVSGVCAAGQVISAIKEDGTVDCATTEPGWNVAVAKELVGASDDLSAWSTGAMQNCGGTYMLGYFANGVVAPGYGQTVYRTINMTQPFTEIRVVYDLWSIDTPDGEAVWSTWTFNGVSRLLDEQFVRYLGTGGVSSKCGQAGFGEFVRHIDTTAKLAATPSTGSLRITFTTNLNTAYTDEAFALANLQVFYR
jgi:hypothetical protein